jgi:hypothetical protein
MRLPIDDTLGAGLVSFARLDDAVLGRGRRSGVRVTLW